jgi:hypothetical protein
MFLFGNGHFIFLYFSKKNWRGLKTVSNFSTVREKFEKKNVKRIRIKS